MCLLIPTQAQREGLGISVKRKGRRRKKSGRGLPLFLISPISPTPLCACYVGYYPTDFGKSLIYQPAPFNVEISRNDGKIQTTSVLSDLDFPNTCLKSKPEKG